MPELGSEAGTLGKWSWACKAAAREAAPLLTGGSSRCLDCKAPGTPGRALTYRAALVPRAHGGSFSPIQGHPDPHPANGAVTPHRLPAEHKGSQTRTLITGRSTPREPESSAFPRSNRNETQQPGTGASRPKAGGPGPQPRGQGGQTPGPTRPGPTPLKGRGQGHPPDYRGSGPSKHLPPSAGDTHSPTYRALPLGSALPTSPTEPEAPTRARVTGWPSWLQHTTTSSGAQGATSTPTAGRSPQPKAAPKAGLRPPAQHFLNLHPLKGEGGLVPVGWLKQPPQPCLQGGRAAPGHRGLHGS